MRETGVRTAWRGGGGQRPCGSAHVAVIGPASASRTSRPLPTHSGQQGASKRSWPVSWRGRRAGSHKKHAGRSPTLAEYEGGAGGTRTHGRRIMSPRLTIAGALSQVAERLWSRRCSVESEIMRSEVTAGRSTVRSCLVRTGLREGQWRLGDCLREARLLSTPGRWAGQCPAPLDAPVTFQGILPCPREFPGTFHRAIQEGLDRRE